MTLGLNLSLGSRGPSASGPASDAPGAPLVNYDFSQPSSFTLNGSAISGVSDLGSAGADLAQATGANQPATSTINTVAALDFDGTADYLQVTDGTALSHFAATNPAFTLAVVYQLDVLTGGQAVMALNTSTSADGYFTVSKQDFSMFFQGFNGAGASLTASGGQDTNAHNMVIVKSATTADVYIDGVLGTNDGALSLAALSIDRITVGAWQQNGSVFNYLNGRVGEIIIYDTVLTGSDLTALQSHIDTKWGF